MTDKREIFRHGRYEHCAIVYWPEMPAGKAPDFIIAMDDKGHEMVCNYAMGIWCEMTAMDVIGRLRFYRDQARLGIEGQFTTKPDPARDGAQPLPLSLQPKT